MSFRCCAHLWSEANRHDCDRRLLMELDARELEAETRLEADVCIIGAGPAGITLARELAASSAHGHSSRERRGGF